MPEAREDRRPVRLAVAVDWHSPGVVLSPTDVCHPNDELRPWYLTDKYVSDTTMTEVLGRSEVSTIQTFVHELAQHESD